MQSLLVGRAHVHIMFTISYTVPEGEGMHTFIQFLRANNMFMEIMARKYSYQPIPIALYAV